MYPIPKREFDKETTLAKQLHDRANTGGTNAGILTPKPVTDDLKENFCQAGL